MTKTIKELKADVKKALAKWNAAGSISYEIMTDAEWAAAQAAADELDAARKALAELEKQ
jgi:hypothetical protein